MFKFHLGINAPLHSKCSIQTIYSIFNHITNKHEIDQLHVFTILCRGQMRGGRGAFKKSLRVFKNFKYLVQLSLPERCRCDVNWKKVSLSFLGQLPLRLNAYVIYGRAFFSLIRSTIVKPHFMLATKNLNQIVKR